MESFSSIESIESIVVRYQYHRIRQGIDTIELVSIFLPLLIDTVLEDRHVTVGEMEVETEIP